MKKHPLKVERELRGWSQKKVADALLTSVRCISRWEQGKQVPWPFYREQLCELFGKNAEELGLIQPISQVPKKHSEGIKAKAHLVLLTHKYRYEPSTKERHHHLATLLIQLA